MSESKKSLVVMDDGTNLGVTFALLCSLFLLWGLCNGMIDVMDKHFQTELGLTKSQSAWVQFAHYLGYFLMAMPAGRLAIRLGYKGGISGAGRPHPTVSGVRQLPRRRLRNCGRPDVSRDDRQSTYVDLLTEQMRHASAGFGLTTRSAEF
jgi:hypothetical protein